MKKLKLNLANMPDAQVLSREQLKKIMGGDIGSGTDGECYKCCVVKKDGNLGECSICVHIVNPNNATCETGTVLTACHNPTC